jgi:hypothetical protein
MSKSWIKGFCDLVAGGMLAGALLAACAPRHSPALDSAPSAAPTDAVAAVFATPASQAGAPTLSSTTLPGGMPGVPDNPLVGLQQALQLADQEMQAAQASSTLAEARHHAEGAANIIVGYWGLWYGDADGDGERYDPSNGRGVLPAGIVQEGANGSEAARPQLGWALILYLSGTPAQASLANQLLGDPHAWQTDPASRYAAIQRAVDGSDARGNLVQKLPGLAEQSLGWARLILLHASTLDEARTFAAQGALSAGAAAQAAH